MTTEQKTTQKNKRCNMKDYAIGLAITLSAVFAPVKELLLVSFVLILVDLVTGVIAAYKEKKKINSAGLRRTVSKLLIYMTAICVGFLIEKFMLEGFIPVSKLAAGLISLVEGKSIFENLDTINGSPIFKTLIEKLGSVNDLKKEVKEESKDKESL